MEWHKTHRAAENLTTDEDTAIMAVPVPHWPTHGQLENWLKALRGAPPAVEPDEGLVDGLRTVASVIRCIANGGNMSLIGLKAAAGIAEMAATQIGDGTIRLCGRPLEADWQPINTAPYSTPVEVKIGGMKIVAELRQDASMSEDEATCDQWVAVYEGEHPPCWSGGACWEKNENEVASLQPEAWRDLGVTSSIRAQALEEAANVADSHAAKAWEIATSHGQNPVVGSGRNHAARDIAASIRALKGGQGV